MPRRSTLRTACRACRHSRAKRDSRLCSARCVGKHLDCTYDNINVISKGSLRSQVQDLQGRLDDADALLDALNPSVSQGNPSNVLDIVVQGLEYKESRGSIVKHLNGIDEADKCPFPSQAPKSTTSNANANANANANSVVHITDINLPLLPKHSSPPRLAASPQSSNQQDRGDVSSTASVGSDIFYDYLRGVSYAAAAYPSPSDSVCGVLSVTLPAAEFSSSQQDTWTSSGWSKSYVQGLILLALDWDGLPLCLVDKEFFLRDFEAGARQFCSPALVSALLAIITRLLSDPQKQDDTHPRGGVPASEAFLQESSTYIQGEGVGPDNLPDIQAVGVLALYEASFGEDVKAANLINEYAVAMADLYFNEPITPSDINYDRIRSSTYRGAISLRRMFQLTGMGTTLEDNHDTSFIDASKGSDDIAELAESMSCYIPGEISSHACSSECSQRMAAGIFSITGWLRTMQMLPTSEQAHYSRLELYSKCLDWYSTLLAIPSEYYTRINNSHLCLGGKSNEKVTEHLQLNVFTHMFYHFCVLKLLAPEASDPYHLTGYLRTRDICRDAAQSILDLAPLATTFECTQDFGKSPGRLASRFVYTAESFLAEPFLLCGPYP